MTRISEAVECLEELGYTVTPPPKPKVEVELPIEPGVYSDRDGDAWKLVSGRWWIGGERFLTYEAISYAPFTKLEPVPVTAKKVLDAVKADIHPGHMGTSTYSHVEACISHVGHQFGVTE